MDMKTLKRDYLGAAMTNSAFGIRRYMNSSVAMYAKALMSMKAKTSFGEEFYLQSFNNISERNMLFHNQLRSWIPDFDKKYVNSDKLLKPFIHFGKIDNGTFIYIATKLYVPNSMTNALMEVKDGYDMYLYIFGKKSRKHIASLKKILAVTEETDRAKKLLMVNEVSPGGTDISVIGFSARAADSMVYSFDEMNTITEHIDKFLLDMEFYKKKQLSFKTGILLYGTPGTGKSTIGQVLANKYNRNIIQINISNLDSIDFAELTTMINNDTYDDYIVLFEDLDMVKMERIDTKGKEDDDNARNASKERFEKKMNDMMQFLDSPSSPNNVIFIATTNYVEKLDKALIREGRFDLKVEVKGITKKDIRHFCDIFEVNYDDNIDKILELYGDADKGLYNQAKLQNILLKLRR